MISDTTKKIVEAAILADAGVTTEDKSRIRSALNGTVERQRMMTPKEAMELLGGITRRTLFEYEKRGWLRAVHIGQRKVRFPASEVERLAYEGMKQEA